MARSGIVRVSLAAVKYSVMRAYYARRWLNRPRLHSFGALIAKVERPELGDEHHASMSASLSVSDCNRAVDLDFDVYAFNSDTTSERLQKVDDVMHKVRVLRRTVNEFCDVLEHNLDQMAEHCAGD